MKALFPFLSSVLLVGCVTVTPDNVRNMTDQGLCDLVDSRQYVGTFREREIVYRELERRGVKPGTFYHKEL